MDSIHYVDVNSDKYQQTQESHDSLLKMFVNCVMNSLHLHSLTREAFELWRDS